MAYRPRRRSAPRKGRKAPRRAYRSWHGSKRTSYAKTRYITETLSAGTLLNNLSTGVGQVWKTKFTDIPQNDNYSKLYRQFQIKKFQMILLPRYSLPDANNTQGFAGSGGFGSVRLAYAIDESPVLAAPVNELDVLQSNGSRVLVCNGKKIVINCRNPRPDMLNPLAGNNAIMVGMRPGRPVWLNTDNADVSASGTSVEHGAIRTWCTLNTVSPQSDETQLPVFDVYYKVTFCLRDPA